MGGVWGEGAWGGGRLLDLPEALYRIVAILTQGPGKCVLSRGSHLRGELPFTQHQMASLPWRKCKVLKCKSPHSILPSLVLTSEF